MSVEVVLDSPLAQALNAAIQPKLVEVGWSTGGADDSALAEYIILMLVNGKTQEQIAAELSGDLLNLGQDDPGAREFAQWLFHQVDVLHNSQNGGADGQAAASAEIAQEQPVNGGQDAEMGDAADSGDASVPTGPKSMRNGPGSRPRDKRMLGQLTKAMDRTGDSVLHRVRPQGGNERINTHARGGPPTGPRQQGVGRGAPRLPNGRPNIGMGGMPISAAANVMNMNPQQQLELYAMLEQQSRLMAQMLGTQPQYQNGAGRGNFGNGGPGGFQQQQQSGRSLFDRVQLNNQRPPHNNFKNNSHNGRFNNQQQKSSEDGPSSSMDVEMSQEKTDPERTVCNFNLRCTKPDCPFAHQSPAAPPGVTIDLDDVCSFGAACKNFKCVGRHPSPAKKAAHQADTDCSFFPNCTKINCPFRHPVKPKPLCRNGTNCSTPGCPFTHTTNISTMCMFNPCTKPTCPYKHEEGQQKPYEDKVWVPGGNKTHVSERKFVDDSKPEELIKPEGSDSAFDKETSTNEVIA